MTKGSYFSRRVSGPYSAFCQSTHHDRNCAAPARAKPSFKSLQMLQARETRSSRPSTACWPKKGFDAMTVDEVVAEVGIAVSPARKTWPVRPWCAMRRAQAFRGLTADVAAGEHQGGARWTMEVQSAKCLAAQPELDAARHPDEQRGLHERVQRPAGRAWIEAQREGSITPIRWPSPPCMFVPATRCSNSQDPASSATRRSWTW